MNDRPDQSPKQSRGQSRRKLILLALLIIVLLIGCGWLCCRSNVDVGVSVSYVAFGWNGSNGFVAVRISDGKVVRVAPQQTVGPYHVAPAYAEQSDCLFYVDQGKRAVMSWAHDRPAPTKVFDLPPGIDARLGWLLLSPDERFIYFAAKSTLLVGDIQSGEYRTVADDRRILWRSKPAWLTETELLVEVGPTTSELGNTLARLDLETSKLTPLPIDGGQCYALSASKALIAVETSKGYRVHDSMTGAVRYTIDSDDLRGSASRGRFCFAGDRHLVLFREHGAMWGVGVLVVDIETGRSRKIYRSILYGMSLISSLPDPRPVAPPPEGPSGWE